MCGRQKTEKDEEIAITVISSVDKCATCCAVSCLTTLTSHTQEAYTCTAREVALVCVSHEWSTKYKCIGPTSRPNYVLVGDESSSNYLEGFSLDFNATAACHKMDFRQNMLFYG